MARETRSNDFLLDFLDVKFSKVESYNFGIAQQLPTYRYFISRYLTLLNQYEAEGVKYGAKNRAQIDVLNEICAIWITLNIYPREHRSIKLTFDPFFKEFHIRISETRTERLTKSWKAQTRKLLFLDVLK